MDKKIDSKILSARKTLRKLHEKYIEEFHEICINIDNFLEELGEKEKKEEDAKK